MARMQQARQVSAYMKKRIPQFNPEQIYVPKNKEGHQLKIILIIDGKLKVIELTMAEPSVEALCRRINVYYENGFWEDFKYYKINYSTQYDHNTKSYIPLPDNIDLNIYQFPDENTTELNMLKRMILDDDRAKYTLPKFYSIFEEVPKVDNFIPYQP